MPDVDKLTTLPQFEIAVHQQHRSMSLFLHEKVLKKYNHGLSAPFLGVFIAWISGYRMLETEIPIGSTVKALYEKINKSSDTLGKMTSWRINCINQITEADCRLFTTLVRFDVVYYSYFKTNKKRLLNKSKSMGLYA